jgi:hypothetical protein
MAIEGLATDSSNCKPLKRLRARPPSGFSSPRPPPSGLRGMKLARCSSGPLIHELTRANEGGRPCDR